MPAEAGIPRGPKLRISEFPDDGHSWRIDWFGEVIFRDRMRLRNHPSINVYLSRLIPNQGIFGNRTTTSDEQQRQCTVSVGKLMLLRIGDVWKDQQLHESPTHEVEIFRDLLIDRETTVLVKAGLSHDEGGFLLPLAEHPGHRRNTHSYCLRVSLSDDCQLVIPCAELIRFYFGSSSELLNLLFRPGLSRDWLYTSRVFNPSKGFMRLTLSDHVHPRSATDIGRIAGSHTAWHAANLCHTSCLKSMATGGAPYPQAVFPFEGETDLSVSGKWLSASGKDRKTFLVYQIHSCSHPFPFNVLQHSGGLTKKRKADMPDQPSDMASPTGKARAPKESRLQEVDPNPDLKPKVRAFNAKRRFPDLDRKSVFGTREVGARSGGAARKAEPIEEEAAGEPGSTSRCRPISIVDALPQVGAPPTWLVDAYQALRNATDIQVELLTNSAEDGWSVPLELFSDEDGVIHETLFMPAENLLGRPRRAAVFNVDNGFATALAVVIEHSENSSALVVSYDQIQERLEITLIQAAMEYCNGRATPLHEFVASMSHRLPAATSRT